MSIIYLNDVEIDVIEYEVNPETEEAGKERNIHRLVFQVEGKSNMALYQSLLEKEIFKVRSAESGEEFKAKKVTNSNSYRSPLDADTIVTFTVTLKELVDGDDEQEWNAMTGLLQTAIKNWARTRALSELLQERNLFTEAEYIESIEKILKRDFEEMKRFILDGK